MQREIVLPAVALVVLTAIVWVRLYWERIGEMRARRISPQSLASSALASQNLSKTQASDNFRNLFEVPVLFYALCAVLASAQYVAPFFVIGAWVYVVLRYVHSFIHLTYNRVSHRFVIYAVSTVVLFVLWGTLGVQILLLRAVA